MTMWKKSFALTRRGLLSVLVVLMVATASTAAAEPDSTETAYIVPSPYTYFDAAGDSGPSVPDFTAVQVRNGPNLVVLRFWLTEDTLASLDTFPALFEIDLKPNGRFVDYHVGVNSSAVAVSNIHHPDNPPTCWSTNVSDLGSSYLGHGFAARFSFRCIGGRRTFRTTVHSQFWNTGDDAPDELFSPYIRSRG